MEETEIQEDVQETLETDEYEYITRSKPLWRLVFMVALTAIMLVSSTYAWFSAQKNVTLGGLTGIVKVAEGLEVSLDAEHWSQEIDFANYTADQLKRQYGVDASGNPTGHTHYDGDITTGDIEHNIVPSELQPVSTTGKTGDGIGQLDMNMYRGILKTSGTKSSTNGIQSDLSEVITVKKGTSATTYTDYDDKPDIDTPIAPQYHDYPGYYAIDIFLKNSTRKTESGTTNFSEIIQLNTNSKLELLSNDNKATGLQNTVRVAFAVYKANGGSPTIPGTVTNDEDKIPYWDAYVKTDDCTASNYMNAPAEKILAAYKGQTINDVAIWEPNASDHVDYIYDIVEQYDNTQYPRFSLADTKLFIDPDATEGLKGMEWKTTTAATPPVTTEHKVGDMRTYALSSSVAAKTVTNIYNWAETPSTGLAAQVTLQTEKTSETNYEIKDGVKNLVSVTSDDRLKYVLGNETGTVQKRDNSGTETATVTNLKMQDGAVAKLRMYVWLEGQDVDTINHASHGGGIDLDVGLLKDGTVGDDAGGGGVAQTTSSGTYLPTGFTEVAAATATSALTIADGSGNEYVWIEVPRNATVYDEVGTDLDLDSLSGTALTTALDNIETELQEYATDYRKTGYADTYSSLEATGIADEDTYNDLKYTMLKSVYENEGFYIGKYETGTMTERTSSNKGTLTEAVIKANAYPYNYVTNAQAQTLATGMASGGRTSSLMFGIQWDLVLKYLEEKGVDQDLLLDDSSSWGHYAASDPIQTGSNSTYSKMGIYDLAGNVAEWTLEQYTSYAVYPCTHRGGYYLSVYGYGPASHCNCTSPGDANSYYGFRVTLY